ncbi:DUF4265 domain-containing protein [Luedemannella helvata]|uniref:DUF4265 domain-containing protein n=1 Tax=Luedemannella helvata TaxID=349315 RepID=A0ABN2L4C6_9ACTN
MLFKFVPREDWLPYDRENLWAIRLSADTARIRNVAFLQDGVAMNDIVRFTTDASGVNWAVGRVAASGQCVIRVVPIPDGPLGRSARSVHEAFAEFMLGGESFSESFPMVAFDVPADADFAAIKRHLESGCERGWWDYEVGCGTDAWWNA